MRDIQGRQIHQFKGAKLEAHLVTQYAVDGGKVRHAFADDTQSLCAIAASCMVDDEARRVLRQNGLVAHGQHIGFQFVANRGRSGKAWHHFHHFHQRHRIEKMQTGKALWAL